MATPRNPEKGLLTWPWIMRQTWHDLLFAHWPVRGEALRGLVPEPLEIDTLGGEAWVGIIAFRLSGVRLRWMPEVPLLSRFLEINVRTYVRHGDRSGVLFLSLDADNPLSIALAKPWFLLPYVRAGIRMRKSERGIEFRCLRTEPGARDAEFAAVYRPASEPFRAEAGSLEEWLTERYSYFAPGRSGLYRCDVAHEPWPMQRAVARIEENTMARSHGIELPQREPLLHYARFMRARIWPVKRVAELGNKGRVTRALAARTR